MAPMRLVLLAPIASLALACAGTGPGSDDAGSSSDLRAGGPDLRPPRDLLIAQPDLTLGPDMACTLGDPDHCGTCTTVCPPGMDTEGTARFCSAPGPGGTCDLQCKGEFYDVDGRSDNGCEAADTPVQDSDQTALMLTLPDMDDPNFKTNPLNLLGKIYSDDRTHLDAPAKRPNGREDWYRVNAVGPGVANSKMGACVSIVSLPADNMFEVCISDMGKTTFDPKACATAAGGAMMSACVAPPGMTDNGTYYVRVRKLSGTPSLNGYALFLKH